MDIKSILKSIEKNNGMDELLTLAPLVGPGAVFSIKLEWSIRFREGRRSFYNGHYKVAATIFRELDRDIPGHDRFLTAAKINETICWLNLGNFSEYIRYYEPFVHENKLYGVPLWNLGVAYFRTGMAVDAELCIEKWVELATSTTQILGKGHFSLSILQFHNGKPDHAISSFQNAWRIDRDFCRRTILKFCDFEMARAFLESDDSIDISTEKELQIAAEEKVLSELQRLLVPRSPGKYPQVPQQLNEFEYQFGYVEALEKFGDGDIDEALKIIEGLLRGRKEEGALLWAKAACLLAKGEWKDAIMLMGNQLDDADIPGAVLWNTSCAYFNLGQYELALSAIKKCTKVEYKTSPTTWLIQGLLAHLCGENELRNSAINEAVRISARELVYYSELLRQMGVDLSTLPLQERFQTRKTDDQLEAKYKKIVKNSRIFLNKGRPLDAAKELLQLSPKSIAEIPEIVDITFSPVILPTCPAKLYKYKEIFLSGIAAFQRKAYEEAVQRFENLFVKTDRDYPVVVNLAASLIHNERYSRAIEILLDILEKREYGGSYAIRNLISAFIRSGKHEDAFPWFNRFLKASSEEYFNFVQMAYVAQLLGKKENVATALFNACTKSLAEPSIQLKAAAVEACLEVKDHERAVALVSYFVKEKPLPYVVAGTTRPIMPARDCKGYAQMKRQFDKFNLSRDARASLAYFREVHSAREADYAASTEFGTTDGFYSACIYYGQSLFWNREFEMAQEVLEQATSILADNFDYYSSRELSKRYFTLTNVYFRYGYYFRALEFCEKGLDANDKNVGLIKLHKEIEQKIEEIPRRSREAMKGLAELPLSTTEKVANFIGLLPTVSQLVHVLPLDFPGSKRTVEQLEDIINDLINLESVPIVDREKVITKLRNKTALIEQELPRYLPKVSISALLPVLKGMNKTLDETQAKSVCPEFTVALEPVCYYRESEASLVFKLKNIGAADIHKLRIKIESSSPQEWAPILEEQEFKIVKKDQSLWIDWPIHLDYPLQPELEIKPKITLSFTGGSLRGELVERIIDDQETNLSPFVDISVDYPVVALRPENGNKLHGRENLIRTLKNSFTYSRQNRIPFLEGVRKVGKTSILYFLAARLEDFILPVYVNMDTTWGNPFQLFAKRISDEISIKNVLDPNNLHEITDRDDFDLFLVNIIQETDVRHIVLLLDEFHAVINRIKEGSLPKEFLGDLRYMYMGPQQKVSVAFADWYQIDELKSQVPAQIWTDLAREHISFLNELDTREAILSPAKGSRVRFESEIFSRIYYWTNGYPWHIQWILSELINHLNTQKRYVVILQDIDLMADRLLGEDRLFNEGVCRRERLTQNSQCAIYEILEIIEESGGDICSWFDRGIIANMRLPFDINDEIPKLIRIEILQEEENKLRFCSPLHARWLNTKRRKCIDIYDKPLVEKSENDQKSVLSSIPENPTLEIRQKCEYLRDLKSQLRQALCHENQIFKNIEMPEEWNNVSIVVRNQDSWNVFIRALRNLFVEDMKSRLEKWEERRRYPYLNKELHSIRMRRNYVEHSEAIECKKEEERCCSEDIDKLVPIYANDWIILQLKALDRLINALKTALEQVSRS